MPKSFSLTLILVSLFCVPAVLRAQVTSPDTSFLKQSLANAVTSYKTTVGLQAHLYTGEEYYIPVKTYIEGHQFFESKAFTPGDVQFDGTWYSGVPLLYDLVLDEVVTMHQNSGYNIMLVKQRIDTFRLADHTFIRLKADSAAGTTLAPGFYDLMHNGKIKMLVRRKKSLQERATTQGLEGEFDIADDYYILKNGTYYEVRSKRSVLKVLEDEKKQLRRFARENKITFGKQREKAILELAKHYSSLKQ